MVVKVFNLRRLQAVRKVKETIIRDVLFDDDCAFNTCTQQETKREMSCFSEACDNLGFIICTKTAVMYQPAPEKPSGTTHHGKGADPTGSRQLHVPGKHTLASGEHRC